MIADYIARYLSGERQADQRVLAEMGTRFVKVTYRQFMEQRTTARASGSYPPSAATKCVRANYGAWIGAPAEAFGSETLIKFWLGDLTELGALALAQLAYASTPHSIGLNNELVDVPLGTREETRRGFIDGMLNFNHAHHEAAGFPSIRPKTPAWVAADGSENLLVECKSMDEYPFKQFKEHGPEDTWGYLGQITVYQRALHLRRFVYVAVNRSSGEIADHVGIYDPKYATLADANYDAVMAHAKAATVPDVPMGKDYGHDEEGRLRLLCRFCSRKAWCYDLRGMAIEETTERGFMGKPAKHYFARTKDGAKLAPPPQAFDAAAAAAEVIGAATTRAARSKS